MGPLCRVLVLCFLAFGAAVAVDRPAIASTGADVLADCKGYPAAGRKVLCETYVQEVVQFAKDKDELVNPKGVVCPGPDVTLADFVASIVRWLSERPELRSKNVYEATHGALARDYPCR